MAQFAISSIENQINSDKQRVESLEQQKIQKEHEFNLSKRELEAAADRLIRQSVELKARFTQEKSNLENEIRNLKRNIDLKEHQLQHLRNVAI